MSHEVIWTDAVINTFIKEGRLTDIERKILLSRVDGRKTIVQQAQEFHMSEASVSDVIRVLKMKYDEVSRNNPALPPRTPGVYSRKKHPKTTE